MSQYRLQKEAELQQKRKAKIEFLMLSGLIVTVALGIYLAFGLETFASSEKTTNEKSLSIALLSVRKDSGKKDAVSASTTSLPENYQIQSVIDERYTIAEEPHTGEILIHDAVGGTGTNATSVDGSRKVLIKDVLQVDHYAEKNRKFFPKEEYDWYKDVAEKGTQLAYRGYLERPSHQQIYLTQPLLEEFHQVSSNPNESYQHQEQLHHLGPVVKASLEHRLQSNQNLTVAGYIHTVLSPASPHSAPSPQHSVSGVDTSPTHTVIPIHAPVKH